MRRLCIPRKVTTEFCPCAVDGCEPADQANALVAQNSEVEVAVVGTAHQLQRRLAASSIEIAAFEGRIVQDAGPLPSMRRYRVPEYRRGTRV
jgi:hypothetical protein